jgi:hypothetical protein
MRGRGDAGTGRRGDAGMRGRGDAGTGRRTERFWNEKIGFILIECKIPTPVRAGQAREAGEEITNPVPSPQSPVPNPQSPVPNPQSPVPSPQSPVPNPQSPVPSPQSPVPSPQSLNRRRVSPDFIW